MAFEGSTPSSLNRITRYQHSGAFSPQSANKSKKKNAPSKKYLLAVLQHYFFFFGGAI